MTEDSGRTDSPAPETEPARMSRRQAWLLVAGLVLLSALLFLLDYQTAPEPGRAAAANAQFESLAVIDKVWMSAPPAVWGETAVFIGHLEEDGRDELLAVDVRSGDVRWRRSGIDQSRPEAWPNAWGWRWPFTWRWGQVVAQNGRFYFSDAFVLTTAVTALDAATGNAVWQRHIGLVNGGDLDLLLANEQQLVAQMAAEYYDTFYALELENGRSILHQQGDAAHLFWYDEDPERFYERHVNGIVVRGDRPWRRLFQNCGIGPQMTADVILVRITDCDDEAVSRLLALSRADGTVLWQLDAPLVGNVATNGETAVALTVDAQLLLLDVRTGALRGVLPFSGATTPPDEETAYFVAVGEETAVVYFGDSHQLFIYQMMDA